MLSQREKGIFQCVNIAIILLGHGYLNPHIYKLAITSLSPGILSVKNYNFNLYLQHTNYSKWLRRERVISIIHLLLQNKPAHWKLYNWCVTFCLL